MRSMDSILSDEPSVHTLPESAESESPSDAGAVSEPQTETGSKSVEVKAQAPTEKVDGDDDSEADHVPDDFDGLKKALSAARGDKRRERKKWQEAERKLAQFEGQLMALRQQPVPNQQAPKPVDDEDSFFAKPRETVSNWVREQVQASATQHQLALRELVASQYQDFAEAEAKFFEVARSAPDLAARLRSAANQPLFAYQTGKALMRLGGAQTVDDFETQVRERVRAELEAERAQKPAAKPVPKPSLANARGTGSADKAWAGPRSLDDIFG